MAVAELSLWKHRIPIGPTELGHLSLIQPQTRLIYKRTDNIKPRSCLLAGAIAGRTISDNGGRDFWGNQLEKNKAADIGAHQFSN